MKAGNRHRMLGTLAVVLAVAGMAAPAASADDWYVPSSSPIVRPDDRAARVSPAAGYPGAAASASVVLPDDRATRPTLETPTVRAGVPDDRAGERGPGSAPTPAHIVVSANGFDWTDAGIGAALAFGLILLGTGGLLVARRQRRPRVAAF